MRSLAHFIAVLLALAVPLLVLEYQAIILKLTAFGHFLTRGFDFALISSETVGFGTWALVTAVVFIAIAAGLSMFVHQARSLGALVAAVTPQLAALCLAVAFTGVAAARFDQLTYQLIFKLGFTNLGVNTAYTLLVSVVSTAIYLIYLNVMARRSR